jgi:hypothetical protein
VSEGASRFDGAEQRRTLRLLVQWRSLRQQDGIPWFSDFDPHRNPVPWERCVLFSLAPSGEIVIEHTGAALRPPSEDGAAGARARAEAASFLRSRLGDLAVIRTEWRPLEGSGRERLEGGELLLYRSLLLPFRDRGGRPAYVLGAATWRIDDAGA